MNTQLVTTNEKESTEEFKSLDIIAKEIGLTFIKKTRDTVRKLIKEGVIGPDDFRTRLGPKIGRGRPDLTYFLSLSGAIALASHARTPQATKWRREQIESLVFLKRQPHEVRLREAFEASRYSLERALAANERMERLEADIREIREALAPIATSKADVKELMDAIEKAINESPMTCVSTDEAISYHPPIRRFGATKNAITAMLKRYRGITIDGRTIRGGRDIGPNAPTRWWIEYDK